MLWAASRRGHTLGYALQQDLYIDQGKAFGLIAPLKVFEDYNHYYELGEKRKESLADYDVILMRKDPPFDMNFVYNYLRPNSLSYKFRPWSLHNKA